MADYKELYFQMARAAEEAIRILIKAQRDCEERYLSEAEPEIRTLFGGKKEGPGEENG